MNVLELFQIQTRSRFACFVMTFAGKQGNVLARFGLHLTASRQELRHCVWLFPSSPLHVHHVALSP